MSRGMDFPQNEQKTLEFAEAEASAAERLMQLGRALRDVLADDSECMLARLIFDQTACGVGPVWSPMGGLDALRAHAWGCRSCETKVKKARARLHAQHVIAVEDLYDSSGRRTGNAYRINWAGVYSIRGLPVPSNLRQEKPSEGVATRLGPGVTRPSEGVTRPSPVAWRPPVDNYIPRGRGRAHSFDLTCLTMTSSTTSVSQIEEKWPEIWELAKWGYHEAFAHQRHLRVTDDTREFMATLALLASTVMPRKWFERVATLARKKKADNPPGFLKRVMECDLIERYALCDTREEAAALMGKMLAAAGPLVERFMASQPSETEVAT